MNDKQISDDELEEKLDQAFKTNEKRKNVFKIIRDEKSSREVKEVRLNKKFKFKEDSKS